MTRAIFVCRYNCNRRQTGNNNTNNKKRVLHFEIDLRLNRFFIKPDFVFNSCMHGIVDSHWEERHCYTLCIRIYYNNYYWLQFWFTHRQKFWELKSVYSQFLESTKNPWKLFLLLSWIIDQHYLYWLKFMNVRKALTEPKLRAGIRNCENSRTWDFLRMAWSEYNREEMN